MSDKFKLSSVISDHIQKTGVFLRLSIFLLVFVLAFSVNVNTAAGEEEVLKIEDREIDNLEELDLEEIMDELLHIRRIDNDLSRLMAYDDFIDELIEKIELVEKRAEGVVAEYSGEDDKVTEIYEIKGPWEVHWESTGRIFQLYVYDENERRVTTAANKTRGGSGIYENSDSGSYYLEVKAVGDWELTIEEAVEKD